MRACKAILFAVSVMAIVGVGVASQPSNATVGDAEAQSKMERRIYPVDELVAGRDSERAIFLIMTFITDIQPLSWDVVGGDGHIEYYPNDKSLAITQRSDTQERIQRFLDRLRELKGNWNRK